MIISKNSKLVIVGDSITDAGRTTPIGESVFDGLGKGYVLMVDSLLGAAYSHHPIRVVNVGTSGNTVRDLRRRWQMDVLDLKPDWVAVLIGVNDVWRQFDAPKHQEMHVYIEEYEATLNDLISLTKASTQGVILMTPFYIEPNREDPMRMQMDRYGDVIKRLALKHDAVLVDMQAAFDEVLRNYYPATIAWDRIHPTATGHMVMARAFLNAIEFVW
jgi:lysophospholipase L1-like esterase